MSETERLRAAVLIGLGVAAGFSGAVARASPVASDASQAAMLCSPSTSHLVLLGAADERAIDPRFESQQLVNYAALVFWGPGMFGPYEHRKGSRSLTLNCGRYTVEFNAGFLNTNPQGESGAVEDYPIVSVSLSGKRVLEKTAMAPCEAALLPRFQDENAVQIEKRWLEGPKETEILITATHCTWDADVAPRTDTTVLHVK